MPKRSNAVIRHALALPDDWPPTLVVVIDTEEEFDWKSGFSSEARSVKNISLQKLAQDIFDRRGVIPTYVVDYPVADNLYAAEFLKGIAADGRCEIGAHLHPWVNPPIEEHVNNFNSFPGNLPQDLELKKLRALSQRIGQSFGSRPTIYKAGRYGLGKATFDNLAQAGFEIDVSVVPHTDFSRYGGPDFRSFPAGPFSTSHSIICLPLSVHFAGRLSSSGPIIQPYLEGRLAMTLRLPGISSRLGVTERLRLSPEGHSLQDMMRQTEAALTSGERYFMMTYHSSTLLIGANDYVVSAEERIKFLETLDRYLSFFRDNCDGQFRSVTAAAASLRKSDQSDSCR